MGLQARKPVLGVCEKQQWRRPACTSVQSDQHHCNSFSEKYIKVTPATCKFFNIIATS